MIAQSRIGASAKPLVYAFFETPPKLPRDRSDDGCLSEAFSIRLALEQAVVQLSGDAGHYVRRGGPLKS